jgi:hypothetical protein
MCSACLMRRRAVLVFIMLLICGKMHVAAVTTVAGVPFKWEGGSAAGVAHLT